MIRPDDRTAEDRKADRTDAIREEIEAMTDGQIHDGLMKAIRILTAEGHVDCTMALIAAAAQVAHLKDRIRRLEEGQDELRDIAHSAEMFT